VIGVQPRRLTIERQIREIAPRRSDDPVAELGRIVGRNLGRMRVGPTRAAPTQPRDMENDQAAEDGSAQRSRGSVEQTLSSGVEPIPDELASPAMKKLGQGRAHALGLAPCRFFWSPWEWAWQWRCAPGR